MTVDLNVLDHLGVNLYSNFAAVLTEVVANAWDADATTVCIKIDSSKNWLEIADNGVGMTVDDMNNKYLRVGYRRREEDVEYGKVTAKGRKVMGRKGLGKLSLFSIANTIEVQSVKDDDAHGLRIRVDDIHQSVKHNKPHYHPSELQNDEVSVANGTKIVLREIKRQRLGPGVSALRKRLARRFSILGQKHDFKILINDTPICANDRDDQSTVQFLWVLGESGLDLRSLPNLLEHENLPNQEDNWETRWNVNGWIGTAQRPKELNNKDAGNLNGIVVFARGRLIHENILEKINDGRLYTKYLTGQIEADFLDQDDKQDIATSDRQRVQEDDQRYSALLSFVKSSLTTVERRWSEWRRKHEITKAKQVYPSLLDWLNTLPKGFRQNAEQLISTLSALPLDDEEDRKLLFRHGIFAFERMRIRGSTPQLVNSIQDQDIEGLLTLLADIDALEAALYCDIIKTRLEVIKNFLRIVEEDSKERVLQQYLFNHLWLLDPSWERATGSKLMESRLSKEGVITEDMTQKERLGRVDIAYRTNAGKHIIVELKKAGRQMNTVELVEQGNLYTDKLKKILSSQGENRPNIEVVFVIGKPLNEERDNPERVKAYLNGISPGSRIVHYDTLITGAQNSYSEYLEKNLVLDKLEAILAQL